MARIAFVGQGGVQLQRRVAGKVVDVDHVGGKVIHGRRQIKGGTQKVLQGLMDVFDLAGDGGRRRKIGSHLFLKIGQDGGGVRALAAGSSKLRGFRVGLEQRLKLLIVRRKLLLDALFKRRYGIEASGAVFDQVFVVPAALRQVCQPSGIFAGSLQAR